MWLIAIIVLVYISRFLFYYGVFGYLFLFISIYAICITFWHFLNRPTKKQPTYQPPVNNLSDDYRIGPPD